MCYGILETNLARTETSGFLNTVKVLGFGRDQVLFEHLRVHQTTLAARMRAKIHKLLILL